MEQKDESVVVRILRNRPPMQRIGLLAEMRREGIGADLKARYDLMNTAIERGEIAVDGEGCVKLVGLICAFCGGPAEGNFSIHRDGFCKGPEVPLCDEHGAGLKPSCTTIWARISSLPSTEW